MVNVAQFRYCHDAGFSQFDLEACSRFSTLMHKEGNMISRKFLTAAIIAMVAPVVFLLPWVWPVEAFSDMVYVAVLSLIGVIVGGIVSSRIRRGFIGGILSFILAGVLGNIIGSYLIPHESQGDGYLIEIVLGLSYYGLPAIIGLIFGLGVGQPTQNGRQG